MARPGTLRQEAPELHHFWCTIVDETIRLKFPATSNRHADTIARGHGL